VAFSDSLFDRRAHQALLTLAVPMILANITTPLLGLVDTAVLGHMDSPAMLAGASVATLILTQIYWVCGFLRMSTTGLSAQARGDKTHPLNARARVLLQAMAIALFLGLTIIALQWPIYQIGYILADPSAQVSLALSDYFFIRVWGAPAAMANLVLVGWLVGQQKTRAVLVVQIIGNSLNALLDVLFVYGFGWSVQGVAAASITAEYTMAILAAWVAYTHCKGATPGKEWFNAAARKILLKLNGDMLLRNLALQACLAFLTITGARLGETQTAVNAVLMQFFVLIALGLDGVAYAVEALVGEAKGAMNEALIKLQTYRGLIWSSLFAIVYAVIFAVFGTGIIALLTDLPHLQQAASAYLPLMVLLPLAGHWCFLFDGVFVGLTQSRAMRNTMIVSAVCVYFPVWYAFRHIGNEALWYALLTFLLARGVTLGWVFMKLSRRGDLAAA